MAQGPSAAAQSPQGLTPDPSPAAVPAPDPAPASARPATAAPAAGSENMSIDSPLRGATEATRARPARAATRPAPRGAVRHARAATPAITRTALRQAAVAFATTRRLAGSLVAVPTAATTARDSAPDRMMYAISGAVLLALAAAGALTLTHATRRTLP
jgi:hypothetical protein